MSAAATAPVEKLTGWRYPRTMPSLPESYHSVHVPGAFVNSRPLAATAWTVAATIVGLNGWLLVGTFSMWLA